MDLTTKEKALCAEKTRLAHVLEVRNRLQNEYEAQHQEWLNREQVYLKKIQSLDASIESGYSYIESTENSLK